MIALHAVVMKRALDVVGGSVLDLAWYSNVLSSVVLIPCIFLVGEAPAVRTLVLGARSDETSIFLWGSAITVRLRLAHIFDERAKETDILLFN